MEYHMYYYEIHRKIARTAMEKGKKEPLISAFVFNVGCTTMKFIGKLQELSGKIIMLKPKR